MSESVTRKSLEPYVFDNIEYYPHQIEGVRQLCNQQNFLLADEMGLGKSLQALTVFAVDVKREWAKRAIIVCPVTLKENWADEIEKFTRLNYMLLDGTPRERQQQLFDFTQMDDPKVLIVNYEQVKPHKDDLNTFKFDVAIFDEAHYLKNYKAQRTQASLGLRASRNFLLTGTPMLNHVNELWPLLHKISPGEFPKYWSFVNRYAVFGGFKNKQIIGVKNEKELTDRLQGVMLRRLKSEVLDLPEIQIIERRVRLTPEQKELYDEVRNEMRLPRAIDASADDIENALTKFLRLKQICGTTFPFTGKDISSKLDLAVADDQEILLSGHRSVAFTQFRAVQECYTKRMQKLGYGVFELHGDVPKSDRQGIVKAWAGTTEPTILCGMLQISGLGLNMTAARHGSFLDKLFVPGNNQQAMDRLHRIGSDKTQPVQFREYICIGTIENRINQILRTKKKLFGSIVEADPDWKRKLYAAILEEED